jgi:hypothetical protein
MEDLETMLVSLQEMEASLATTAPTSDTRKVVASTYQPHGAATGRELSTGRDIKTSNAQKDMIEMKENQNLKVSTTISTNDLIGRPMTQDESLEVTAFMEFCDAYEADIADASKSIKEMRASMEGDVLTKPEADKILEQVDVMKEEKGILYQNIQVQFDDLTGELNVNMKGRKGMKYVDGTSTYRSIDRMTQRKSECKQLLEDLNKEIDFLERITKDHNEKDQSSPAAAPSESPAAGNHRAQDEKKPDKKKTKNPSADPPAKPPAKAHTPPPADPPAKTHTPPPAKPDVAPDVKPVVQPVHHSTHPPPARVPSPPPVAPPARVPSPPPVAPPARVPSPPPVAPPARVPSPPPGDEFDEIKREDEADAGPPVPLQRADPGPVLFEEGDQELKDKLEIYRGHFDEWDREIDMYKDWPDHYLLPLNIFSIILGEINHYVSILKQHWTSEIKKHRNPGANESMIRNFLKSMDTWSKNTSTILHEENAKYGPNGNLSEYWKQHDSWSSPKYDKFSEVTIQCGDEYKSVLDIFFSEMYSLKVSLRVYALDENTSREYLKDITARQKNFETEASKIKKRMNELEHEIQKISAGAAGDHHEIKDPEPWAVREFVERVNKMIDPRMFTDTSNIIKQQLQSFILHSSNPSHVDDPSAAAPEPHMPKAVFYNFRTELIRFTQALLSTAFPPTPAVPFPSRPPPVTRGLRPPLPAAPFPAATCPALHALCARVAHITAVSDEHPHLAALRFELELANRSALVRLARKEVRNSLASAAPAARAALEKRAETLESCLSDGALRLVLAANRYGHEHVHVVRPDEAETHGHKRQHQPKSDSEDEFDHDKLKLEDSPRAKQPVNKHKTASKLQTEIEFMKSFERELDDVANEKV